MFRDLVVVARQRGSRPSALGAMRRCTSCRATKSSMDNQHYTIKIFVELLSCPRYRRDQEKLIRWASTTASCEPRPRARSVVVLPSSSLPCLCETNSNLSIPQVSPAKTKTLAQTTSSVEKERGITGSRIAARNRSLARLL